MSLTCLARLLLQMKRPRAWTHWSQRTTKPRLLQRSWPLKTCWPSSMTYHGWGRPTAHADAIIFVKCIASACMHITTSQEQGMYNACM